MYKKIPCLIYALLAGCLFFSAPLAIAAQDVLPGDIFTAIMLKSLDYDRNIDRHAQGKVVIAVVCISGDERERDFADQVKDNISTVQSTFMIKDKPIAGKVLSLEKTFDKAKLREQLRQENVSVLVLAVNDLAYVSNIFALTREMQISSVCREPGYARNGVGLEIIQKDGKPRMVINLASVKQEGGDYSSKYLDLCEVIK